MDLSCIQCLTLLSECHQRKFNDRSQIGSCKVFIMLVVMVVIMLNVMLLGYIFRLFFLSS